MNYDELDPGIRDIVRLLNESGHVTTDSGDGVSKPADWYASGEAIPFPHVVIEAEREELCEHADAVARLLGPEWNVEATYQTLTKTAHLFARAVDARER